MGETIGLFLLLLCFLVLFWQTFYLEPVDLGAGIGPAFWIRSIIGLALLFTAVQIHRALKKKKRFSVSGNKSREQALKILMRVSIVLGYLIAVPYLGFFWASPLFLFFAMTYFGRHSVIKNISISLFVPIILLIIYISILYVPLPKGIGVFEDASNFLLKIFLH